MVRPIQLMIGGAQKAGTTSLLRYLAQHPHIHTHPQTEFGFFLDDLVHNEGYPEFFVKSFGDGPASDQILLAKHVMLMYSPKGIERLYHHNPNVHLTIMLRNPVDRAYSAYWYARRKGWEPLSSFEAAIEAEDARLSKDGWDKWRNCAYLYNGTYYPWVRELMDRFGDDKVHVFLTNDLRQRPKDVCQEVFSLFDIDAGFITNVNEHYNQSAIARSELFARLWAWLVSSHNPIKKSIRSLLPVSLLSKTWLIKQGIGRLNEKEFTPPPMKNETCHQLIEYFKPYNSQLATLLERDLSIWNE